MTRLQVRAVGGFLRAMAQTTQSREQVCLLGVKKIQSKYLTPKKSTKVEKWGINELKFLAENAPV